MREVNSCAAFVITTVYIMKLSGQLIEQWVSRNFPDYKKRSHGKQLVINNPFDGDAGRHFWISTTEEINKHNKKGFFVHDFRPGRAKFSGSFINFVRKYKNISYFAAIAEVTGGDIRTLRDELRSARIKEDKEPEEEHIEIEIKLPTASRQFTDESTPTIRKMALNYLKSRCVSEETAIKMFLHYTPGTLVFPYIEYGNVVFWQERDIGCKRFNFPNEQTTGLIKTNYLYNFDNVEPCDYIIVVESIFNCISVGDNCVATGGATISGRQPQKLKVFNPSLIILAPDNDDAGIKSIRDNFFLLHKDFKLAYSIPPGDEDWNDMDQKSGVGIAKNYIENHTFGLTLPVVDRLMSRVK